MNLVKPDSYISSREEGEARLKHLISAYREQKGLPALNEDGSGYVDGHKPGLEETPRKRHRTKTFSRFRKHSGHNDSG